jgi:hypothetical protein
MYAPLCRAVGLDMLVIMAVVSETHPAGLANRAIYLALQELVFVVPTMNHV